MLSIPASIQDLANALDGFEKGLDKLSLNKESQRDAFRSISEKIRDLLGRSSAESDKFYKKEKQIAPEASLSGIGGRGVNVIPRIGAGFGDDDSNQSYCAPDLLVYSNGLNPLSVERMFYLSLIHCSVSCRNITKNVLFWDLANLYAKLQQTSYGRPLRKTCLERYIVRKSLYYKKLQTMDRFEHVCLKEYGKQVKLLI